MFVRKSFQFRLLPTKSQAKLLQAQLDECRWLYNELLSQRKLSHEELSISLSKYQQLMFLPLLKEERPSLKIVHSQALQNIVDRLDKAFQSFFRRCKTGEKPGFPRFRGAHRYDSFCYPQSGFALLGQEIYLSKMGRIRMKMHRPIEGEIKTCTIKKSAAEEAGRKLGLVNPAYTSQICSQCGHLEPKKLTNREHKCSQCGYTAHRDLNAAQNILAIGLDGLGVIPRSLRL